MDAAEALAEQLDAVVLVGVQAVHFHTGDADFVATAAYTTDADFCVSPADLNLVEIRSFGRRVRSTTRDRRRRDAGTRDSRLLGLHPRT